MRFDNTPNVRAEAANSLSLFGRASASHLVQTFVIDDHWLVRRSILAALVEKDCPEEVLEVCHLGLAGNDITVQEAAVSALGSLVQSRQSDAALSQLLTLKDSDADHIRVRVAYALKPFDTPHGQNGPCSTQTGSEPSGRRRCHRTLNFVTQETVQAPLKLVS